ncbi:hypothetical protein V6N11_005651 [Hibiscus sabdariffa]|uniref:Uncharacterized protein n=1 Tax=Hibiscus sabdariffa TaxID=183260 RepID=A0ABR2RNX4_9ROSI
MVIANKTHKCCIWSLQATWIESSWPYIDWFSPFNLLLSGNGLKLDSIFSQLHKLVNENEKEPRAFVGVNNVRPTMRLLTQLKTAAIPSPSPLYLYGPWSLPSMLLENTEQNQSNAQRELRGCFTKRNQAVGKEDLLHLPHGHKNHNQLSSKTCGSMIVGLGAG